MQKPLINRAAVKLALSRAVAAVSNGLAGAADVALRIAPSSLVLAGMGLITFGVGLIHVPSGVITGGVFTLAVGLLAVREAEAQKATKP